MQAHRISPILASCLFLAIAVPGPAQEQAAVFDLDDARVEPRPLARHANLSSVLERLVDVSQAAGLANAAALARRRGLRLDDSNRVLVTLAPRQGRADHYTDASLSAVGCSVNRRGRRTLRLAVPIDRLSALAERFPDADLMPSESPEPDEEEGVMVTAAFTYHIEGSTGSGVRVAVIDGGFEDISTLRASGDLDYSVAVTYTDDHDIEAGGTHGTSCALVIHQMAPDAELYLYRIGDVTDLESAVDDCISRGVDVISHSMSWYGYSFNDGTGTVSDIAGDAISAGITWFNSAGNRAESHWYGSWSNPDGDSWCNISGSSEVIPVDLDSGDTLTARLTWDDFTDRDQDYDLYLYMSSGGSLTRVDRSTNAQPGSRPYESFSYTASSSGTYYLAIKRIDASGSMDFQLFTSQDISSSYQVAEYSVTDPGSKGSVLAVAAMYWSSYDDSSTLAGYSSRGPTPDGRTKPDIAAPTSVGTALGTFTGTSCACPSAAGAMAVYLSDPVKGSSARSNLLSDAIDMGATGMDSVYGRGRLELDPYDDGYEDNDGKSSAASLSTGTESDLIALDADYYTFEMPAEGRFTVSIEFDDTYGDLDLRVYKLIEGPGGLMLASPVATWSSTSDSDDESISVTGASEGTYIIKVWLDDGDANRYDLSLTKLVVYTGPLGAGSFGG